MPTITYESREEWLADRHKRIGASESPGILGHGYSGQSAFSVYAKKVVPGCENFINADLADRMKIGLRMEPVIRGLFFEDTGFSVQHDGGLTVHVSEDRPHLGATLDGIVDDRGGDNIAVFEAKNVGEYAKSDWFGPSSSREAAIITVPLRVQIQVQHQLYVTGLDRAYVAVLIGGNWFGWTCLNFNKRFVYSMLVVLDDFWDHVLRLDPPQIDGTQATSAAIKYLYREDDGETVALPAEAKEWDESLVRLKKEIEDLESDKRLAENRIKAAIGDAAYGELQDGIGRYSWKSSERNYPPSEAKTITIRTLRRLKSDKG